MEQYFSLILSIIAILISVFSWHKNRVIYEILKETDKDGLQKINYLLKNGEYTILHVQFDSSNSLRTIYTLGRVKNCNKE